MNRLIFFVLLLTSYFGYSQKTIPGSFKIVSNTHPENEAFYIASIEKADMEKFRLRDKEVTLAFENGFQCVMLSVKQIFIKTNNEDIKLENYQEEFPVGYTLPYFNILENGLIMGKSFKADKRSMFNPN